MTKLTQKFQATSEKPNTPQPPKQPKKEKRGLPNTWKTATKICYGKFTHTPTTHNAIEMTKTHGHIYSPYNSKYSHTHMIDSLPEPLQPNKINTTHYHSTIAGSLKYNSKNKKRKNYEIMMTKKRK